MLVGLLIFLCVTGFGFCWTVVVGGWLGAEALNFDKYPSWEGTTRLAYAGAASSVVLAAGLRRGGIVRGAGRWHTAGLAARLGQRP